MRAFPLAILIALVPLAFVPLAAAAQDIASPEAVWGAEADLAQCNVRPWVDAFGDCLASLGAPEAAVEFAIALQSDPAIGVGGVLGGFDEHGEVDRGIVVFPALANANQQDLFVNGTPPLLSPADLEIGVPADRISQALEAAHPEAMDAGPPVIAGYRDLPDGGQRFVLTDRVVDGCRACAVLATSVTFVDFRDGVLSGVTPVAWVAPEIALEPDAAAAAMEEGDAAVVQYRLILNGYDAGAPDGLTGPRTRAALTDFLAENCLPDLFEEPEFRIGSIAVLAGLSGSLCEVAHSE